jgi:uncharacterized membrane protein
VPSFASEIGPLISSRCAVCHTPGGQSADRLLTSYAQIFALRSSVLNQVYACKMPKAGAAPLSASERAALLAWLVCGAPMN